MKAGQKINMKYLIIGAGGTGGVTGYYMKKAGKDVTLIARGEHLKKIQKQGLTLEKMWDKTEENISIPATDMEHYAEHPDVIFVCVKGYSLQETIPFIKRIARKNTIVIPVLNIYGTGGKMQKELPDLLVTDGCIYVSANIKEPGKLLQHGQILHIVFGVRDKAEFRPELKEIQKDLCDSISTGLFRKTSAVKHWRNFPMYPRSGQQDSITTQLPQISRKKAKPENFLRPW